MKKNFTDRAAIGDLKTTQEGHISTVARAVRTGIQEYTGAELGFTDRDIVRVYRPPEEVFSQDSLQSFSHATVTINHPPVLVDSENWKEYAAGEVSTAAMKDGEWVALPLMLKDKAAIDAANSGMVELSAGYTAEIEMQDGVTESGEKYDAIQRNIRINHLALVDKARAGSQARIGDTAENWGAAPITQKEEVNMTDLSTVVVGDKAVQVAANDADTITKLIADHKSEIDAKDEAIGNLKAQLADAESKILSDDDLQAKVKELADAQANREKAKDLWGDEAIEGASDAEIKGMMKVADQAKPADDKMRKALGDAKSKEEDPWGDIIKKKDAK
jgi:hypothetical protein